MTQIKRRNVISGLRRKGFKPIPNKYNDLWFGLTIDDEFVPEVKTFVSGGSSKAVIQEPNIQNMVRELHMDNKRQFLDYINCPYRYEQYVQRLREKRLI